ncbi:hypothetical protein DPMN_021367 [Dreissena polymorpha]|uniref:Uncharacterized protein n=2 Tax=Dreissena polymorpha TaxID=45954 RepID=A0A9D4SBQ3_DREPO|nr:hypothetical protein DPMN_021367 [Dreissena polymorpha]
MQLTNNQEIPANVAAIIDSTLSNSKDKITDSVADLIKSASSKTTSYINQDDQSDVARAYNSATGKTNKEFPANFADFFKSFPSTNVKSYNDVNSYNDIKVTSNTDERSNVDVAKRMQDAFANAGDNKQGKWQKLSNGNFFKADNPSVQKYNDVKVSSSISNPDGSNINVNNILKNALGNAGNTGNAQSWQNAFKGDTPSVQNYRDVKVSTGNSDGSNVVVNKIIKDHIENQGGPQVWQNSYNADTPSVQNYRDVKVSNINSNTGSDGNKVIKDALASADGAQKNTWQSPPSGNSVRVDTPSVQAYNDNKYPTPNSNGKSDNSNTDFGKRLQDAFGKIGNGQQSSWPNFANVQAYQYNNKPNGQVSSTSDRQTYTNTKTEPKQVKSWRGSYTRAPNYGTTPGSSWGRNNAGQCLLRGELCKVGSGPECCASDNAYGSKVPLCCTRIASGSSRSDFGLCQPKNPGMTCDRR